MISILGINFQLSSCSMDDTVGIVTGVNFDNTSMIKHNNQTGRWISSFRYKFLSDYQMLTCLSFVEPSAMFYGKSEDHSLLLLVTVP